MKRRFTLILTLAVVFAMLPAADYDQLQKIVASDRGIMDGFGASVSISGDYVIVGQIEGEIFFAGTGAALIFYWDGNTWTQQAKLEAFDKADMDRFGCSVSISGDYAIVGALYQDKDASGANNLNDAGAAYVFKRSGTSWALEAKLVAADRAESDNFGNSVYIDGDYAIVGAKYEDEDASGANTLDWSGSAYVFKRSGTSWAQEAKLVAADRGSDDRFGWSVSIDGDYAIVGAALEDDFNESYAQNAGSAYIFKRSGTSWAQEVKLVPSDRAADDSFGESVSISGDYAIIGASYEDDDAAGANYLSNAGSAYIFKFNGISWAQEAKLVAADRAVSDYFGHSVSISGDYAVVGATGEDEDASGANTLSGAGSAYVFKRSGTSWAQEAKLVASDRAADDKFAQSVSISSDHIIVGALNESEDASGANTVDFAGSAYLYVMPAPEAPTRVSLSSFFAEAIAGNVQLTWRTESEIENSHFIIYRNGEAIATILGAGTTSKANDYSYTDTHIIPGLAYTYVLADVDLGNKETRYENKAVTITVNNDLAESYFVMHAAYPNPFNPSTTITYHLPSAGRITANIYDMNGVLVEELTNGFAPAGDHELIWNASDHPSGVYILKMGSLGFTLSQKIVLMK